MKTYRATFNPELKGVYGISLVSQPAMEGDFLTFKKQEEVKFAEVDKEKRILMGLVLEPNKLIYRNQGGEEFNVFFSEQDIEDVAYNFQKQSSQTNSTIEHSNERIEGVTFVETWTIENPEVDKSTNFGFNYPKGSWMAMMKVDNDEVWNNYVKSGKVNGFSIDALMKFEEVKLNKQVNMESNQVLEFLKELPNKIALALKPEKEVAEVTEEVVELTVEETVEVVAETEEVEVALSKEDLEGVVLSLSKTIKDSLEPLKKENEELTVKLSKLQEDFVKLSEQPAANSISSAPVQVDFSKMNEYQIRQYHKSNG